MLEPNQPDLNTNPISTIHKNNHHPPTTTASLTSTQKRQEWRPKNAKNDPKRGSREALKKKKKDRRIEVLEIGEKEKEKDREIEKREKPD